MACMNIHDVVGSGGGLIGRSHSLSPGRHSYTAGRRPGFRQRSTEPWSSAELHAAFSLKPRLKVSNLSLCLTFRSSTCFPDFSGSAYLPTLGYFLRLHLWKLHQFSLDFPPTSSYHNGSAMRRSGHCETRL